MYRRTRRLPTRWTASSLSGIQVETDAIAGRVNHAIERAARHLEPKVQTVMLDANQRYLSPPAG
jgi:hypothetical protein